MRRLRRIQIVLTVGVTLVGLVAIALALKHHPRRPSAGLSTAERTLTSARSTSVASEPSTPSAPQMSSAPQTSSVPQTSSKVTVSDARALQQALATARPGMVITLADGDYHGNDVKSSNGDEPGRFVITQSGTASAPITLRGSRKAILDGGGVGGAYAVHLLHAQYWHLVGFSVGSAAKGIVLDGSSHNLLSGLHITNIGQEGVHFRAFSSDNTLRDSVVDNTGVTSPNFGEGVYLGSAVSNWGKYSGGQPDRSDRNQVLDNRILDTGAECVDIKEGTTAGTVRGNYLGGDKIAGKNSADSWIDVKGNNYVISGNHGVSAPRPGTTTCGDPKGGAKPLNDPFCDGIQVHVLVTGWGADNVFEENILDVNAPGVGIWLQNSAVGLHNVIRCNNVVLGAESGRFATDHYTPLACSP